MKPRSAWLWLRCWVRPALPESSAGTWLRPGKEALFRLGCDPAGDRGDQPPELPEVRTPVPGPEGAVLSASRRGGGAGIRRPCSAYATATSQER